ERYSSQYLLNVEDSLGSLRVKSDLLVDSNWVAKNWGNSNPLIVEIGSGQGENIVAAAESNPNINFLALEVYDPGVAHTMLLAGKQGVE
nr:tRNA (guanine-N7)-methyltransferase [Gardnerella vaginalis]